MSLIFKFLLLDIRRSIYLSLYKMSPGWSIFCGTIKRELHCNFLCQGPLQTWQVQEIWRSRLSGFLIKCNFSLDGLRLASGSSDGCIYFYDAKTCELIKKIKVYEQACIHVAFHPVIPNVIASCSWNGDVSIFEWAVNRQLHEFPECLRL